MKSWRVEVADNKLDSHAAAYRGKIIYDFDNEILLKWYPKRIIDKSNGLRSVLELGLGHGFSAQIFAESFSRHVILEGSRAVIEHFRKTYPAIRSEVVETFFEEYDSSEKFDLIVMGFILEHVEDPVQVLKHFRKFHAANGRTFIAVPNAEVMNRRLGHMAGLLKDITELSDNDHLLGHKRYYTLKTLTADVESAGYKVLRAEGIYLKPFTTSQVLSLNLDKRILDAMCNLAISYPELSCGILAEIAPEKTGDLSGKS